MFPSYNSKPRKEKKMEEIQTFMFLLLPLHFSATKHGSNEKLSKKPKLQTNPDNQKKKKNKNTCCFVE